jgi:hypothetical protein
LALGALLFAAPPAEASWLGDRCYFLMTAVKEATFGTPLNDATLASMKRVREKGPITDSNYRERHRELYLAARKRLLEESSQDPYDSPSNGTLMALREAFESPEPPESFQPVFEKFMHGLAKASLIYPSTSLYVVPGVERLAPEFLDMLTIRNQHRDPEVMARTEKSLISAQNGRRRLAVAAAVLAVLIPTYGTMQYRHYREQRTVQDARDFMRKLDDFQKHPEKFSQDEQEKMSEEYRRLVRELEKQAPKK